MDFLRHSGCEDDRADAMVMGADRRVDLLAAHWMRGEFGRGKGGLRRS